MRATRLTAAFASLLLVASALADWPNFRGPRHDGISEEKGLRLKWDTAPKPLWQMKVGDAFSSFSAVGDRIYTCGEKEKKQVALCLNADTGQVIWSTPFEDRFVEDGGMGGNGTRSTPTVADGRVYVLGAKGRLVCMDAKDGKEIWSSQFSHIPTWGYSASVLVDNGVAYSGGGKEQGALVAFDAATGKQLWKLGDNGAGYATPYPFDFGGKHIIGAFVADAVLLADAKTGKQLASIPWKTDWDVNAAALVFDKGLLFVSSGYKTGSALFKLGGSGDAITADNAWGKVSKVIMNKFQSSILYKGNLYTSDQKALKCVDFASGNEKWSQRGIKDSTLVLAEDHLILLTEDGELQIAPASDTGFTPTAKAQILQGRCWSVPVIHNGRLYARSLNTIVCIDLKNPG